MKQLGQAKSVRDELISTLKSRIMYMDGAMGTMIQRFELSEEKFRGERLRDHTSPLIGCNDVLSITQPQMIEEIHREYLEAGSDFISTNTFNSTSIAMGDYQLQNIVYDMNYSSAVLAKKATQGYANRYVIGVLGPTNKTLSLSPSVEDPGFRDITFVELVDSYTEQTQALLDGGVDIIMVETIFDTLNAKAALFAVVDVLDGYARDVPIFISGTVVDLSGRTLSGQTVEAMVVSLSHVKPLVMGLNCALGAAEMRPFIRELGGATDVYVSCYPNAGLPNSFGGYDDTPEQMAVILEEWANARYVNIFGGCCGTTPDHIRAIIQSTKGYLPRVPDVELNNQYKISLSGLEPMYAYDGSNFINIGERCNVAGSSAFKKVIKEENYTRALEIARTQITDGAQILDINFDDGMLDGVECMRNFVNLISTEPEISKVPLCIDSSDFQVIEAGLRCAQGKCIVNSISLKEGEEDFLLKAKLVKSYGAAVVIMAFDQQGQADTLKRKIEVCQRSYNLLTEQAGFNPRDIIFDPNVLTIGTGLQEHADYGKNYIACVEWIKSNLPHALVSGGISNLSFAFRGNNPIREALHSVFLYHCTKAGLDMGIVHAGNLPLHTDIPPALKDLCEELIWNKNDDVTEKILDYAANNANVKSVKVESEEKWSSKPLIERLNVSIVEGIDKHIVEDVEEARTILKMPALSIIEGPLLDAMGIVGDLFGSGKMFLPQVIKSARVMKKAVGHLEPFIDRKAGASNKGVIIMATVKGDVHDIGKNIVGVVLGCNNFKVVDLGVMCSLDHILNTAAKEKADLIGVSGLITPSLREMVTIAKEMTTRCLTIPLLIGGATTSRKHTAVKIWPEYPDLCIYVPDASRAVTVATSLINDRTTFMNNVRTQYDKIKSDHSKSLQKRNITPISTCRNNKYICKPHKPFQPNHLGVHVYERYSLEDVVPLIDWKPFFDVWQLRGRYPNRSYPKLLDDATVGSQARKLLIDAEDMLGTLVRELRASAVVGLFNCQSLDDDVVIEYEGNSVTLYMLRQQVKSAGDDVYCCLSDFISPDQDYIGMFECSVFGSKELADQYQAEGDDYMSLLVKSLADRLVEALAEHLHSAVRKEVWGYEEGEKLRSDELHSIMYKGIRPAPGYPSIPDDTMKRTLWDLLQVANNTGATLTETLAMDPAPSVCGLYIAHPQSHYFSLGLIGRDQVEDFAQRQGLDVQTVELSVETALGYEP